jgi:hypothetical protein
MLSISSNKKIWIQRFAIGGIVLLIITLTVISIMQDREKRHIQEEEQTYIDVNFVEEDQNNQDTDNDGVADWEERLWGLNPEKADSDGDGVSDARYIASKKNEQLQRELGLEGIESNLSESQKLGRSIYTALLAVQSSGAQLSAEDQEAMTDNIAQYIENLAISDTLYVREDLTLVEDTQEHSYTYQDRLEGYITQYPFETRDLELLTEAVENPDAYRTRINEATQRYQALEENLAAMEVPFAIGGRHTEFLNSVATLADGLDNLRQDEPDDLISLALLAQLDTIFNNISISADNIQRYFEIIEDETVFTS